MTKILFLFATIIFSFNLYGQTLENKGIKGNTIKKDTINRSYKKYSYFTFDFYYGTKAFSNTYSKQLNNLHQIALTSPPNIIGLGFSNYGLNVTRRISFLIQMFYSNYLKSHLNVQDSIPSDITGFSYHFGLGKILKSKNRRYSLASYVGFNTGRLKLLYNDGFKQKNGFFSPKISIQPKIMLTRKISISLICDYDLDVSKTQWRNINNKKSIVISNFNQSGFIGLFSLGYCPY